MQTLLTNYRKPPQVKKKNVKKDLGNTPNPPYISLYSKKIYILLYNDIYIVDIYHIYRYISLYTKIPKSKLPEFQHLCWNSIPSAPLAPVCPWARRRCLPGRILEVFVWVLPVPGSLAVGKVPPANASLNRNCLLRLFLGTLGCSEGKLGIFFPPFLPACVPANTNLCPGCGLRLARGNPHLGSDTNPGGLLCRGRESSSEIQGNGEI